MNLESIILYSLAGISGIALLLYVKKNGRSSIQLVALHALLVMVAHGVQMSSIASEVRDYQLGWAISYPVESYAFVFFTFASFVGAYMLIKAKFLGKHIEKFAVVSYAGLGAIGFTILVITTIAGL